MVYKLLKYSRAINLVNVCVNIQRFGNLLPFYQMTSTLMMETEVISETLFLNSTMTRLISREGFSRLKDLCFYADTDFVFVIDSSLVSILHIKVMTFWCLYNRQMKVFESVPERRRVDMQKVYFETSVFLVRTFPSYLPIQNWTIYKASGLGRRSLCHIFTRKSLSWKVKG